MTVVEKRDGLGPGDRGGPIGGLKDFGDGRQREIFTAASFIAFLDDVGLAIFDRFARIDQRPVFAVGEQAVVVRVGACRDGRAIHVRRGGIDGVMMAEGHAFAREFPKSAGVVLSVTKSGRMPSQTKTTTWRSFGAGLVSQRMVAGRKQARRARKRVGINDDFDLRGSKGENI